MAIVRTVQHVLDKYLQHMRVRFDAGDIGSLTLGKAVGYLTEFGRLDSGPPRQGQQLLDGSLHDLNPGA